MKTLLLILLVSYHLNLTFSENPSVVIVGAGAAGIGAATKLLENSITNITILEAENRIGGRIHSVQFGDGFVDLGAEFCHGEEDNIVFELAKNLSVLERSNFSVHMYDSGGDIVPKDLSEDLLEIVFSYSEGIDTTSGLSLQDALLESYNLAVLEQYNGDKKKFKLAKDALGMLEGLIATNEGFFSWSQISAGTHAEECKGDQALTWKTRGYHLILDILMKSFPDPSQKLPIDDKILLNKKVEKIVWKDQQVQIKCSDNTTLTANHVIFSPSVAVLKQNKDSLFEPKLPKEKLNALEGIGMDGVMKIVLHFPEPWWKGHNNVFILLWTSEDAVEFSEGPSKNGRSWVTKIVAFDNVKSNPSLLIAWLSGDILLQVEKTPEDVLLKGCNYAIKKFFGKQYNVTKADQILRSQWNTNPNFLGTFSYEKVGYFQKNVSHQNTLGQPLFNKKKVPVVLFAGEATHPLYYASVQGAISSGIREAERIIKLHKLL